LVQSVSLIPLSVTRVPQNQNAH